MAICAFPVVPAPPITIPISPDVSLVEASTAFEGAPVSFASLLTVVPVLDAKRGQIFAARYQRDPADKTLIRTADNMLSFSKQNGKNRVSVNLRKIETLD